MIEIVKKILKVFDENHLWDRGIELIGSWCFILYQKHFGVKPFPLRTVDIDFLIPLPYKAKEKIDLIGLLEPLGFKTGFNSDGSIYLWSADLKIEFLTAERGRGTDKAKEIKNLSLKAIPLRFVDMLFKNPVLVKEEGVKISIPNPAVFAVHKILISDRRKKPEKKHKDLEQALHVLEAIDLDDVKHIYHTFPKTWRKSILDSLQNSVRIFPLRKELIQKVLSTLQHE
ncbi:MAG: GSU2403 family nucleotidyltransferase fold protein [Candidatus Margulisiibacteriota bacterium]|nr:GSU2403 family nucleotidyltransferase fold protein [Candidatus Margulisiibacteriota bacterium]